MISGNESAPSALRAFVALRVSICESAFGLRDNPSSEPNTYASARNDSAFEAPREFRLSEF